LTRTIEQLSPGYLILIGGDGNIPHQAVMRSIALLGQAVIPALHEIVLHPYAAPPVGAHTRRHD
jgi:hypothetical protein